MRPASGLRIVREISYLAAASTKSCRRAPPA